MMFHPCYIHSRMRDNRFIDDGWRLVPRGDVAPHWSGLYVTMNPKGYLHLSAHTHRVLGEPEAFRLLYHELLRRLILAPVELGAKHAYPAAVSGKYGGKVVRAYRLITEHNLRPPDTIECLTPTIAEDNILMLDFNKVRISPKAHSQCRAKAERRG